tara:strand:- start:159 stop:359 length:201 start_codon:yes stop_codon:yes gene_type:complete
MLGINFSITCPFISLPEVLIITDIELFKDRIGIIDIIPNNNKLKLPLRRLLSNKLKNNITADKKIM